LYRHSPIILICIYINGYEIEEEKTTRGCFSSKKAARKRKTYSYETRLSPDANDDKWNFGEEKPYALDPVFFSGKKGSSASAH
jgi:hypothetical protein